LRNHRDLKVWRKSYSLSLDLYRLSRDFPKEELYGLTSQLRRAAISIGANLAEGCGRRTNAEMARFIRIAMALPASSTTLCYFARTSDSCNIKNTSALTGISVKWGKCWLDCSSALRVNWSFRRLLLKA